MEQLAALTAQGLDVQAIMSEHVYTMDTRFGKAADFRAEAERITGRPVISSIAAAEPLGPKTPLEALIIAPCTGNTLAKIAHGITDTTVTMAAKAHLRSNRPLVIALASNDALSANLKNIAAMLMRKNVYFVPMKQDDPEKKPHSLVADFALLPQTLAAALEGRQFQRLFQ
jgi:dipicolinate synthase subunit B